MLSHENQFHSRFCENVTNCPKLYKHWFYASEHFLSTPKDTKQTLLGMNACFLGSLSLIFPNNAWNALHQNNLRIKITPDLVLILVDHYVCTCLLVSSSPFYLLSWKTFTGFMPSSFPFLEIQSQYRFGQTFDKSWGRKFKGL